MNRESRRKWEICVPDQKPLTVCIKEHLFRMCQTRDPRLGSWCYSKEPGQNTLGCSGMNFSPYCFINVSKRPNFASVWKKKPVSNLAFRTKTNLAFWQVTDTSNQASSASPQLPMHNRSLIWPFHNIQYKSLPTYLLQTSIRICHSSDYFFLFLCIFHIQNHF